MAMLTNDHKAYLKEKTSSDLSLIAEDVLNVFGYGSYCVLATQNNTLSIGGMENELDRESASLTLNPLGFRLQQEKAVQYWHPLQYDIHCFSDPDFKESDMTRGAIVVGLVLLWRWHPWFFRGVDVPDCDVASYFCQKR